MADTPALWAECKHGEGSDFLHYGDRNVRQVPAGALLIDDYDAAVERMVEFHGHFTMYGPIMPVPDYMERLLLAAVGGQPEGRGIGCWPPLAAAEGREDG